MTGCTVSRASINTSLLKIALTGKYVLSELGSPGKSGSFFYFSQDYRFIIKTISHTEFKFLLKILAQYVSVRNRVCSMPFQNH